MKERTIKISLAVICPLALLFVIFILATHVWDSVWDRWENPASYATVDKEGVFHIYSKKDMKWFIYYVNKGHLDLNAVLEEDLDARDDQFFAENYAGHFDGQGHTILNHRYFLWRILEKTAVVENLVLKDVDMRYKHVGPGGVAFRNYGEIRNCRVSGRIEGPGYVGGIVSGNFGLIEDCINYADIISTETGEGFEQEYYYDAYGAGGIAGVCGSGRSEKEEYRPEITAVIGCENYGSVTAYTLAGGICAYMEDRTNEGAPNLSVQELIETTDFEVYPPEDFSPSEEGKPQPDEKEAVRIEKDLVNGRHYSMIDCKNYGTVMTERMYDRNQRFEAAAAGICGELYFGDLYHCTNLGRVEILEEAPVDSETGYVYTRQPYAITANMGLSPSIHHVVDCVNLKGTMPTSMWPESVMEVMEEELELWEQGKLPYVSNNWRFQLENAVSLCYLEPLGVEESSASRRRDNLYQCEEFVLSLPEGFVIREKYIGDTCYALHIAADKTALQKLPNIVQGEDTADFEVWLLRREANVEQAYTNVVEYPNRMEGIDHKYFMEAVYDTIPNYWFLRIDTLNAPFHQSIQEKHFGGRRIFMESGLSLSQRWSYQQEGNHVLGNFLSMPLEGNWEEGLEAKWLFVFTNQETNICPEDSYADVIEQGFYPLDGKERLVQIREGDSLTTLALRHTGEGGNWRLLADINGITDPDMIVSGRSILVPDREAYEKKPAGIYNGWFAEEE